MFKSRLPTKLCLELSQFSPQSSDFIIVDANYSQQDRFDDKRTKEAATIFAVISASSVVDPRERTRWAKRSASRFQFANIPDVSRLLMHCASRKNPNYVTTSNHYHSSSVAAASANRRRNFRLPWCIARLALTPVVEIDTREDCSVIRLISREINIKVSLGEVSYGERSLLVKRKKKLWKLPRKYRIKFLFTFVKKKNTMVECSINNNDASLLNVRDFNNLY